MPDTTFAYNPPVLPAQSAYYAHMAHRAAPVQPVRGEYSHEDGRLVTPRTDDGATGGLVYGTSTMQQVDKNGRGSAVAAVESRDPVLESGHLSMGFANQGPLWEPPPPSSAGYGASYNSAYSTISQYNNVRNTRPMTAPAVASTPFFYSHLSPPLSETPTYAANPPPTMPTYNYDATQPMGALNEHERYQMALAAAQLSRTHPSTLPLEDQGYSDTGSNFLYNPPYTDGSSPDYSESSRPTTADTSSILPPQQLSTQLYQQYIPASATLPVVPIPSPVVEAKEPKKKGLSFVDSGTHPLKRPRRRFEEIERLYNCDYAGCTKSYGTLNHLNSHKSMQKHGPKSTPAQFKQVRKIWRAEQNARKELAAAAETGSNEESESPPLPSPVVEEPLLVPRVVSPTRRPVTAAGNFYAPYQHNYDPNALLNYSSQSSLQKPAPPGDLDPNFLHVQHFAAPPADDRNAPSAFAFSPPPVYTYSPNNLIRPTTAPSTTPHSMPFYYRGLNGNSLSGSTPTLPTPGYSGLYHRRSSLPTTVPAPSFSYLGPEESFDSIQEEGSSYLQ